MTRLNGVANAARRRGALPGEMYPRVVAPGHPTEYLATVRVRLTPQGRADVDFYDDGSVQVSLTDLRVALRTVQGTVCFAAGAELPVRAYPANDGSAVEDVSLEGAYHEDDPVGAYHQGVAVRRAREAVVVARGRLTAAWLSQPFQEAPGPRDLALGSAS